MKIHKIEKNIPIPEGRSRIKYPWPDMDVGDSVLIQAEEKEPLHKLRRKIWQYPHYYGKKNGKKFKTMLDHEANGVRVWRIE